MIGIDKRIEEAQSANGHELPVLEEIKVKFFELIKKIKAEHEEKAYSLPTTSPLLRDELDTIDFLEALLKVTY